MQETLTDQQWQTFEEQGYVRLGELVSNGELHALQRRIDDIMMGTAAVPYDRVMMQLDSTTGDPKDNPKQTKGHKGATLAYRKIQGLELDPLFLNYMQKPLFRDICERAYGPGIPISIFRAMFMNKPAQQGTRLPWHQDYFHHVDRPPIVTVWMAMDDSRIENGCVRILPGSHHHFPDEDPVASLNEEQVADVLTQYTPKMLECEAGEGFLLHNRLLHSSEVNSTNIPRRAFSVCYMDGRAAAPNHPGFSIVFGEGARTGGPTRERRHKKRHRDTWPEHFTNLLLRSRQAGTTSEGPYTLFPAFRDCGKALTRSDLRRLATKCV